MTTLDKAIFLIYLAVCSLADIKITTILSTPSIILLLIIQLLTAILYLWRIASTKLTPDKQVVEDSIGAARICFLILNIPLAVCILSLEKGIQWSITEVVISSLLLLYEKGKKTKYFSDNKTSIHIFIKGYAIVFFIASVLYIIETITNGALGIKYIDLTAAQIILLTILSILSALLSLVKNSLVAQITSYNYRRNPMLNQLLDEKEQDGSKKS